MSEHPFFDDNKDSSLRISWISTIDFTLNNLGTDGSEILDDTNSFELSIYTDIEEHEYFKTKWSENSIEPKSKKFEKLADDHDDSKEGNKFDEELKSESNSLQVSLDDFDSSNQDSLV